jgi:hypothetical protein
MWYSALGMGQLRLEREQCIIRYNSSILIETRDRTPPKSSQTQSPCTALGGASVHRTKARGTALVEGM